MVLTLAAVAENKAITPEKIDVRIGYRIQTGKVWSTNFHVQLDLGGGLTRREKKILFNSAKWCEVSKLLSGEKQFEYELVSEA